MRWSCPRCGNPPTVRDEFRELYGADLFRDFLLQYLKNKPEGELHG